MVCAESHTFHTGRPVPDPAEKPAHSQGAQSLTIGDLLETAASRTGGRTVIHVSGGRSDSLTYTDIAHRVRRLAAALIRNGAGAGARVGILDHNSRRYMEAFFAVPMANAVLHPVNTRRSRKDMAYAINHAGDDVLIVNEDFLPRLIEIREALSPALRLILIPPDHPDLPSCPAPGNKIDELPFEIIGEYEALIENNPEEAVPFFPGETDPAILLYNTGNKGRIRGVMYSHRQVVTHTFGLMAALCAPDTDPSISGMDVFMPGSPMFHAQAWGFPYLFTLLGARQVYPCHTPPEALSGLIREHGVSFCNFHPPGLKLMLDALPEGDEGFRGLKMLVEGQKLSPSPCRRALDLGINLCSAYGVTESGPLVAVASLLPHMRRLPPEEQVAIRCRSGRPVPLVSLEVVDARGKALPRDGRSIGEVRVRTPWMATGYFKDAAASREKWQDGWLCTGDIGAIDADDYLRVTDRVVDGVKTEGELFTTSELEDVIVRHEAVSEAAVTSVPDEQLGETALALVVLLPGKEKDVTEDSLRTWLDDCARRDMLPRSALPERIAIVDAIPTSGVGKINRRTIHQQFEAFDLDQEIS